MPTLLRIDCSARQNGSHSRALADYACARWRATHPGTHSVDVLDLVATPVAHISEATITGFYTPEDQLDAPTRQALAVSDRLIKQLMAADALLLSVPIYNFSIPSSLKAYIDQIVRAGKTFGFDPAKGFEGLVGNKPVYVVCSYGAAGYGAGRPLASMDFVQPYLRSLLGFLGMQNVQFFTLEGTTTEPNELTSRKAQIEDALETAFLPA